MLLHNSFRYANLQEWGLSVFVRYHKIIVRLHFDVLLLLKGGWTSLLVIFLLCSTLLFHCRSEFCWIGRSNDRVWLFWVGYVDFLFILVRLSWLHNFNWFKTPRKVVVFRWVGRLNLCKRGSTLTSSTGLVTLHLLKKWFQIFLSLSITLVDLGAVWSF